MCDGMACQRRICSICRSAGLLWQPAHPRWRFLAVPSPTHLNHTYINHFFIRVQTFSQNVSCVRSLRLQEQKPGSAPLASLCFHVKAALLLVPQLLAKLKLILEQIYLFWIYVQYRWLLYLRSSHVTVRRRCSADTFSLNLSSTPSACSLMVPEQTP